MPRKVELTALFLRLKQLRESHQISGRELAKMTGISHGTIASWESGRVQDITLDAIRKLAPAYGMTPETLTRYLNATPTMEPDGATVQFYNAESLSVDILPDVIAYAMRKQKEWEDEKRKEAEGKGG